MYDNILPEKEKLQKLISDRLNFEKEIEVITSWLCDCESAINTSSKVESLTGFQNELEKVGNQLTYLIWKKEITSKYLVIFSLSNGRKMEKVLEFASKIWMLIETEWNWTIWTTSLFPISCLFYGCSIFVAWIVLKIIVRIWPKCWRNTNILRRKSTIVFSYYKKLKRNCKNWTNLWVEMLRMYLKEQLVTR